MRLRGCDCDRGTEELERASVCASMDPDSKRKISRSLDDILVTLERLKQGPGFTRSEGVETKDGNGSGRASSTAFDGGCDCAGESAASDEDSEKSRSTGEKNGGDDDNDFNRNKREILLVASGI